MRLSPSIALSSILEAIRHPIHERCKDALMSAVNPGVYKSVIRVRQAYPFDIAGLFMRFYSSMMSIGTVSMLSLTGYSFMTSGIVASVIAFSIFLISPRISKLIDEHGQSKVIWKAAIIVVIGLVIMLSNVALKGPEWVFFPAALLMGCIPNAQAIVRARWTYMIRTGLIKGDVPEIRTVFSFEGVLDDLAFMVSPPFAILMASTIAPIAGLLAGGIAFIVGVVMMCAAKGSEPTVGWGSGDEEASDASVSQGHIKRKSIIRTSSVVRILFVLMFLTGAFYGIFDTSSVAFAEKLGNPNIAGIGLVISALLSAVMGFVFGMIRINASMYKQVLVSAVLIGTAYGLQILIDTELAFYVISAFAALFYAPFLIINNSAVERAVPGAQLTEAITWVSSGMTCGVALGPTMAGFIVDLFGAEAGFDAGGLTALLIPIVTICCYKIIKRNIRDGSYEVVMTSSDEDRG